MDQMNQMGMMQGMQGMPQMMGMDPSVNPMMGGPNMQEMPSMGMNLFSGMYPGMNPYQGMHGAPQGQNPNSQGQGGNNNYSDQ